MIEQPAERGLIAARVGSYQIIRPLAQGGMAQLFLARAVGPEGFEKTVVLKRILPHHAEDPKLVRLFVDEAKLVAGFDHPHIAHVYDMGTLDGAYFFTMEHVHGPDVNSLLRRCKRTGQPLPIAHAVMIARDIASALHYAHERRAPDGTSLHIVHRDVSPSNIIVSYDGVPKLIDFGIAKATSSSIRTQTGMLKGKVSYMSPEQARAAPLDRRSDVFSLGIVLWEMIACRQLHKGKNEMAMLERIVRHAPPPLEAERAECPPELARIVERAVSLDPGTRFPTAQALQLSLEELARERRLPQSRITLSEALRALFADEIRQWNEALRTGPTVTSGLAAPAEDSPTKVAPRTTMEIDVPDDDDETIAAPPPRRPSGVRPPAALPPAVPPPKPPRPAPPPRRLVASMPVAAPYAHMPGPGPGPGALAAMAAMPGEPEPGELGAAALEPGALEAAALEPGALEATAVEPGELEATAVEPGAFEATAGEPAAAPSADATSTRSTRLPPLRWIALAAGVAVAAAAVLVVIALSGRSPARSTASPPAPEEAVSAEPAPPAVPPPTASPPKAAAAAQVEAKPATTAAPAAAEPPAKTAARKPEPVSKPEPARKPAPPKPRIAGPQPAQSGAATVAPAKPRPAQPAPTRPPPKQDPKVPKHDPDALFPPTF